MSEAVPQVQDATCWLCPSAVTSLLVGSDVPLNISGGELAVIDGYGGPQQAPFKVGWRMAVSGGGGAQVEGVVGRRAGRPSQPEAAALLARVELGPQPGDALTWLRLEWNDDVSVCNRR